MKEIVGGWEYLFYWKWVEGRHGTWTHWSLGHNDKRQDNLVCLTGIMLSWPLRDRRQPAIPPLLEQDHVCCLPAFGWTTERILRRQEQDNIGLHKRRYSSSSVVFHEWSLWFLALSNSLVVVIVNHLIAEAQVNPGFSVRWKVSCWASQTENRQLIKANPLRWSYSVSLSYCSYTKKHTICLKVWSQLSTKFFLFFLSKTVHCADVTPADNVPLQFPSRFSAGEFIYCHICASKLQLCDHCTF